MQQATLLKTSSEGPVDEEAAKMGGGGQKLIVMTVDFPAQLATR